MSPRILLPLLVPPLLAALLEVPPAEAKGPLHPDVLLRDDSGTPVLDSGRPVSTARSCGECHDTAWIATHGAHTDLGLGPKTPLFDPLVYAFLDDAQSRDPDAVQRWLAAVDGRHAGGAFAESVGSELDCLTCHLANPDDEARRRALTEGAAEWAVTATLARTGLVEPGGEGWRYRPERFDAEGKAPAARLGLTRPTDESCGQCHGRVEGPEHRAFVHFPTDRHPRTETTGVIISPARMNDSAQNLRGKTRLSRPWDVHAERLLGCATCHTAPNDPTRAVPADAGDRPEHLRTRAHTPRLEEFLRRPDHDFGASARCESCHAAERVHEWLPYRERHLQKLECASCHVPHVHGVARSVTDWSVPSPTGEPRLEYRGVDGNPGDPATLIEGYEPVLLPRVDAAGHERLAPHNLMATWYWMDSGTKRPVSLATLQRALYGRSESPRLPSSIAVAFDTDTDGRLDPSERRLDTAEKEEALRTRLREVGIEEPELRAELRPYTLNHGVAPRAFSTRDCESCHGPASRLARAFPVADFLPGNRMPTLVDGSPARLSGGLEQLDHGALVLRPTPEQAGVFLLGASRRDWVDTVNRWALLLVISGVVLHGGLRLVLHSARQRAATVARLAEEESR